MNLKEMSLAEFKEFASTHFIGNFHESINYALIKAEEGYEYEFISYGADEVVAAALILYKKMAERVGFEPTVGYKPTPIFKTGAINQLDHLSI